MKKQQTKAELRPDALAEAKATIQKLTAEKDQAVKMWMEEAKAKSEAMGNAFKVGQLDKQLRVIGHIAKGEISEAITEILTPLPILFSIDVQFADDKTRMAAEDELLAGLKKQMATHLEALTLARKGNA